VTVSTLQVTGTRGEVHPLMQSRVDTEFYQSAYARARNVVVSRYGPLVRVPGTLARGRPKTAGGAVRMLPFEFSESQTYELEFGEGYIRFWSPAGQVFDNGNPYEVASPYDAEDLVTLHAVQSGDKLYLFSASADMYELSRAGETNWTLSRYEARDGPYRDLNTSATTLKLSDYASLTPTMTDNSTPSGTVTSQEAAVGGFPSWHVFDKNQSTTAYWPYTEGWVEYQLPGSTQRVSDAYALTSAVSAVGGRVENTPSAWVIEGSNDGTNWTVLDTQTAQYSWYEGERRFYQMSNKQAFNRYRLRFWANNGPPPGENYTGFSELAFNVAADDQTPLTLTASGTTGINDDTGFNADDVGRSVRILASDGRWRWLEIVGYTSPTVVSVRLHGHALPDLSSISSWALGVFKTGSGPRTGVIYEDRLVLAGSTADPVGLWFSVSGAYDLFRQSQPLVADDGFSARLTGGTLDAIKWLAESGQLLAGTASVLRSVGARGTQSALAHDNVKQRAETHVGASDAQPEIVENVVLFIDRMKKKLFEAAFSYEADGYLAREVSTLNGHLFSSGVEQIVFVDAPHKVLVVRRSDGKLVFFAYDREQRIAGGTLVDLGGFVEDVSVLRGEGYPQLWLVVRRERPGGTEKFIEVLAGYHEETRCNCIDEDDAEQEIPVYGACSYVYDDTPTTGLTGLDALKGVEVGVWADGRDIGDATVAMDGTLVLPHDTTASRISVGERRDFYLESLRLTNFGQQDGAGLGRKVRVVKARVDLFESAGVRAGSVLAQYPLWRDDDVEVDPGDPTPLVTGMIAMPVEDSFQNSAVFVITGNSMYPATIRAVSLDVEGEP